MTYIALRTETGHFYEELGRFLITKKELLLKGIIKCLLGGKKYNLRLQESQNSHEDQCGNFSDRDKKAPQISD